jgi:predicted enzyme related to lactoylglutathione lyase
MPNPVVHFEISGKDVTGLGRFYKDVFGSEITPVPTMNYETIAPGGPSGIGGGIGHTDGPGRVTFYIQVDDLDAALDRIQRLGGKIVMPPIEIPNIVASRCSPIPKGTSSASSRAHHYCGIEFDTVLTPVIRLQRK